MQWLIDLIQDWVNSQGFLTTSFVDRGDPAAVDFVIGNFVQDVFWHDLDLSSIVPKDAKAVTFTLLIIAAEVGKAFSLRKNGNTNTKNVSSVWNIVGSQPYATDMIVACDSDRKIEYTLTPATWFVLDLTVKGWWL